MTTPQTFEDICMPYKITTKKHHTVSIIYENYQLSLMQPQVAHHI